MTVLVVSEKKNNFRIRRYHFKFKYCKSFSSNSNNFSRQQLSKLFGKQGKFNSRQSFTNYAQPLQWRDLTSLSTETNSTAQVNLRLKFL